MSDEKPRGIILYEDPNYSPQYNIDVKKIDPSHLSESDTPFIDLELLKRLTLRSILVAGEFCDMSTIDIAQKNISELANAYNILGFPNTAEIVKGQAEVWLERYNNMATIREKMEAEPEIVPEFSTESSE